jgi:hypothetical protein
MIRALPSCVMPNSVPSLLLVAPTLVAALEIRGNRGLRGLRFESARSDPRTLDQPAELLPSSRATMGSLVAARDQQGFVHICDERAI